MKIKTIISIAILLGIVIITIPYAEVKAQSASLWKFTNSLLQPVVNSWNVYAPANLRFDGEIQPDGTTCSNGQILKRTGANDWDCAADNTGGGGSNTTTTLAGISGDVLLATTSLYSNNAIYFTTSSQTITLNYPRDLDIIATIATSTGSLIVGSSTNWVGLAVGSDNTCLIASSTGFQNGIGWGSCSGGGGDGGITSLNGLVGLTQTFATSTLVNGGFQITSAGSAHTFKISEILDRIAVLATSTNQILVATGLPTAWASQDASTLLYLPGFITGTSSAFTTPLGVSTSLYLPGFITGTSTAFTTPLGVSTSLYLPGFITGTSSAFATPLGVSTSLYLPGFITATSSAFTTPTGVSTSLYLPGFITATSSAFTTPTGVSTSLYLPRFITATSTAFVTSTVPFTAGKIPFATTTNSITDSQIEQNATSVGIGVSPDTSVSLDVIGQVRIRGGSPGANKTLTSDANGVGSWTTAGASPNTTTTTSISLDCNAPLTTSTPAVPNAGGSSYQSVVYNLASSLFTHGAWAFSSATSSAVMCTGYVPEDIGNPANASLVGIFTATTTATASSTFDIWATSTPLQAGNLNPSMALFANVLASTTPIVIPTTAGQSTSTISSLSSLTLTANRILEVMIIRYGQAAADTQSSGDVYLVDTRLRFDRLVN